MSLLPPCIGRVEATDQICHGDPAAIGRDALPCAERDRCRALQIVALERGVSTEALIQIRSAGETSMAECLPGVITAVERAIRAWRIEGGAETRDTPRTLPPPRPTGALIPPRPTTRHGRRCAVRVRERHAEISKMALAISDRFRASMGTLSRPGRLPLPGEISEVRALERRGRIAWSAVRDGGTEEIATLQLRMRSGTADLWFAWDLGIGEEPQRILGFEVRERPMVRGATTMCLGCDVAAAAYVIDVAARTAPTELAPRSGSQKHAGERKGARARMKAPASGPPPFSR